jgi:acyl-CoA thioesterase-1
MFKYIVALFLWSAGAAASQDSHLIMVYGDSLSSAYGIPQNNGWVTLLQQRLTPLGYRVVNASISGETTSGGLARIDQSLAQHKPEIVVLELGANDGLRGLPPTVTHANLDAIISASQKAGARVLLVGMSLPPNYGTNYTKKFQSMYLQLAETHRLRLVPFLLEGFGDKREYFQADGMHPTADAQGMILETVWKALHSMLNASP